MSFAGALVIFIGCTFGFVLLIKSTAALIFTSLVISVAFGILVYKLRLKNKSIEKDSAKRFSCHPKHSKDDTSMGLLQMLAQWNWSQAEGRETDAPMQRSIPSGQAEIDVRKIRIDNDHALNAVKDFYIVDVETTGLNSRYDKIIEIAIVHVLRGKIIELFHTLINPQRPISAEASAIHGLFADDLIAAPTYAEVAPEVATRLNGKKTIVGHNVDFDIDFLKPMLAKTSINATWNSIDTVAYARRCIPNAPNHKLQTLIRYCRLNGGTAHRSKDDALATLQLYQYCEAIRKRGNFDSGEFSI